MKPQLYNKYCTLLTILLCAFSLSHAQQSPVFSGYFFNKFLINPAFTGIDNEYRAFGYYRTQWGKMPNRPVTGGATAEGSFWKDRIGVGLQFTNDRAGIFNQNIVSLSYAQKITIAHKHIIAIGISGSINMNTINFTQGIATEVNDPGLGAGKTRKILGDLGLGISYSFKGLVVGFAVPNVIQPKARYAQGAENNARFTFMRQYNAFIQYKIHTLKNKFNITPSFLMRKAETSGFQFEGTVALDYKNIVFAGAGYRSSFGVVMFTGVRILDIVTVAYAFDFTTQKNIAPYVGSTHELTVGFHLPSGFKAKKAGDNPNNLQPNSTSYEKAEALKLANDSLLQQLAVAQQRIDSLQRLADAQKTKDNLQQIADKQVADSIQQVANAQKSKQDALQQANEKLTAETANGDKEYHKAESMTQALVPDAKNLKGKAIMLDKISFEYKSATLKTESHSQLNSLAGYLRHNYNMHITIKGYTDSIGSDLYNVELSRKRAQAVRNYLFNQGVESERMQFIGMGKVDPIADNGTDKGREQNRRVEFLIDEK
ncbi:MAG: PorP/SprF family type IX secretion system membrane protein [Chitinophagales bacterium]|nr:PorP/SprF family type IX secretion system membrane protein [Chitinophagales bacterium]